MSDKVKVLVVDDSAFARIAITRNLESDPELDVIGSAKDGNEAIDQVKRLRPDVVTMDVSMPGMDGIEALGRIMTEQPTPVIMLSALTGQNTHATLEALEKGAVDFFLKPSMLNPAGRDEESETLHFKIKIASRVPRSCLKAVSDVKKQDETLPPAKSKSAIRTPKRVLVIGSSTGGPKALAQLVPEIPANIPAAILLIQHMPSGFTTSLAQRLDSTSAIEVKEAENGDRLSSGKALLAPGGYHVLVNKKGEVVLDEGPKVCGVRPSIDVTMKSVAEAYGDTSIGVVLTGMGSDGTDGASLIRQAGGKILAEHESSCAVYGMPRSVIEAGHADKVVSLKKMSAEIVQMCSRK